MMLYVLTCYWIMVRELTAVYWDRRFDAFDPELVALSGFNYRRIGHIDPIQCYNAVELFTAQLSRASNRLHARPPEQLRHRRHQFTT